MKNNRFYFVTFKEKNVIFGLQIGLYPNLSLWLQLPYVEIRMGIVLKK